VVKIATFAKPETVNGHCKGEHNQQKMKQTIIYFALTIFTLTSCNDKTQNTEKSMATTTSDSLTFKNGYSEVNGLKMYYEIHGQGKPIVLIHGGGSTI